MLELSRAGEPASSWISPGVTEIQKNPEYFSYWIHLWIGRVWKQFGLSLLIEVVLWWRIKGIAGD